jgi:hypothetical protein
MSAGSLTLGGNMSIAFGPLGRNGEATGSINSSGKMAAMSVGFPPCIFLFADTVNYDLPQVQLFEDEGTIWRRIR